jgi:hypothetical protein
MQWYPVSYLRMVRLSRLDQAACQVSAPLLRSTHSRRKPGGSISMPAQCNLHHQQQVTHAINDFDL